jgi:hypothetical protein
MMSNLRLRFVLIHTVSPKLRAAIENVSRPLPPPPKATALPHDDPLIDKAWASGLAPETSRRDAWGVLFATSARS